MNLEPAMFNKLIREKQIHETLKLNLESKE